MISVSLDTSLHRNTMDIGASSASCGVTVYSTVFTGAHQWKLTTYPQMESGSSNNKLILRRLLPRPAYGALSVAALIGLVTLLFDLLTSK